ncbi:hypothetical protein HYR99_35775 [Candidatus Poribacteria bacterium]|nr:hypothetical protein [Candidatus Poribacteria bacterium]
MIKYQTIVDQLRAADHRIEELTYQGRVAVSRIGGRVVGMAFSSEGENLLWSNPQLSDTELLRNHPEQLVGGIGGDRLWFAPEFAYHWEAEPDLVNFKNYKVPVNVDPGNYQIVQNDDFSIGMRLETHLTDHRDGQTVTFEVERTLMSAASPLPHNSPTMQDVNFVGIRAQHHIRVLSCPPGKCVGLWHLLQMPVGSTLIVPTRGQPRPLAYFNKGGWHLHSDHLRWTFGGEAAAKIGFDVNQVTGRTGVIRPLSDGRWALVIRQFPVLPGLTYCDGPSEAQAVNQMVQCWDGFGFGEMEYHSPAVGAPPIGPEYTETALLWAFGGTGTAIERIAAELLGVRGVL